MISYNYDCPGTNQMTLNIFPKKKQYETCPGPSAGGLSQGTASPSLEEWFWLSLFQGKNAIPEWIRPTKEGSLEELEKVSEFGKTFWKVSK